MTQLVDPYGWRGPFFIRLRSENCISLTGDLYIIQVLPESGAEDLVDPYRVCTDGKGRFPSVYGRKIASHYADK